MYYTQIIVLAVMILFSGVFSATETALVSLSQSKVDELVSLKKKNSKILKKLKSDPHRLLITILIGNNIVNIGASAYAAVLFTEIFHSDGVGIATGVMTFLILVFGEITPKAFAHQHSVGVSLFMARPVYIFQILLFPFVLFFDLVVDVANKFSGGEKTQTVTEGEIVAMIKIGTKEGTIEKRERELIENVLEFNDIEVEEVMTPRVNIEALDSEMTIKEAVEFAIKHSHSRIPVFENDIDNIIGIVSIKQLLKFYDTFSKNKRLKNLDIPVPLQVPESKKINKLFREFQRKYQHIAIVIDEYGGTAGLVTMEDLIEEIVGDIEDESDVRQSPIEVVNKRTIMVSGLTLIEDINDFFQINIGVPERETVNSMIIDHLHRFPREGETIVLPRIRIMVEKMDKNVIKSAKVIKRNRKVVEN